MDLPKKLNGTLRAFIEAQPMFFVATAAAEGRGVELNAVSDRARDGITGARKKGHIGFQDHGAKVQFRNIRIRTL